MQAFFGRGEIAAAWREFHAPLLALGISAVLTLVGWRLRSAFLPLVAGGAAVFVGWWAIVRPAFLLSPHTVTERLAPVAAATLLIAVLAQRLAARRGAWPPMLVMAIICAWWMAAGPITWASLVAGAPVELAVTLAILAVAWLSGFGNAVAEPLRPLMAALTLAGALRVAGASWLWVSLALVPAAALLPLLLVRGLPPLALLPVAADLAVADIAAPLSAGGLARGRPLAIDAAAVAPLLALWLFPHAAARLSVAGRFGRMLAALVCGTAAIAVTWVVMRLRR